MLFRPIVRYIGMPSTYLPIYNILWNSTTGLISVLGTTNTFRVLYRMNTYLRNTGSTLAHSVSNNTVGGNAIPEYFIRSILPVLNPTGNNNITRMVTENLLTPLLVHLPAILEHRNITIKILYFIMSTLTF